MIRHGMTLIELLAALAILAAVSVAAASWTVSATRTSASVSRQLTWERSAIAALDLIASDLNTGDLRRVADDAKVDNDHLRILTREVGPAEHEYALDEGRLVRRSFRVDNRGRRTETRDAERRILVGQVRVWSAKLEEDDDGNVTALSLEIHGPDDQHFERRHLLP